MMELLSPAGSPEAVIAAVQNGADAVYLGLGDFNARRGAKNFTDGSSLVVISGLNPLCTYLCECCANSGC